MRPDLLRLAAELAEKGEPFAWAVVVRREPASSARAGDMALVTEAGAFHGWLGGSCTQPAVAREARRVLADGVPRLIALSPDPGADRRPGVTPVLMACASGGSVDIFVEPVLPSPCLLVCGASPAARALARLGKALGYSVEAADPDADAASFPEAQRTMRDLTPGERARLKTRSRRLFVVVATMGQWDEDAVAAALEMDPAYLGVVASRKRFHQVRETLLARGVSPDALDAIRSPAGLDLGAEAPEEVALSVLAEIVQERRAALRTAADAAPAPPEERDPICGMTVEVKDTAIQAMFLGHTYYFCCGGCREKFLASPDRFVAAV